MSSQSSTQNLAPIMPFIEPIEPIELPSVFDLQASTTNQGSGSAATDPPSNIDQSQKNPTAWKGKANATNINPSDQYAQAADKHRRAASQEEAVIEKTRMELEEKISELNQLKNQLAQTEQRERELASRIVT
ncbi:hypothetical protein PGTUg99_025000 [Puccinia graminis f. sp. tritici]|uniref:Uncharacterized protein n=2 Tax=Puccinia graminis f. sp. tritici TaxID=56615 RepID=E3JT57_PUCGT|nr:uncharacterized protein PGTG_01877 [Puccinia graminis f. sp. tritici CRL 75-36-700-3]EFP75284.1 hypothetical protein PGTG_01877 [Puccinia graminis f. sp. tritici CRL 75-36-700-3]KAA1121207.1 hypothetical protein PGTUg99_025000 [Puccinia graminis f. sp. tritici]